MSFISWNTHSVKNNMIESRNGGFVLDWITADTQPILWIERIWLLSKNTSARMVTISKEMLIIERIDKHTNRRMDKTSENICAIWI